MAKSTKSKSVPKNGAKVVPGKVEETVGGATVPLKAQPLSDAMFNSSERKSLYAAARYLSIDVKKKCSLQIPFEVFLQDPLLSESDPAAAIDKEFFVNWEPGLTDGPTSARFAVVDYNGDTGHLASPAKWDENLQRFVSDGQVLDERSIKAPQFHQVSVWALVQRTLEFFEEGNGLGRRIPWGFDGNRLIVVPHAGYGENAFYDRGSKSLQFYYFGSEDDPIYTCLSTDIVCHEFGHAVLDGVRPHFNESTSVQTAAFHEAVGDMTAILICLRTNTFRRWLAEITKGDLGKGNPLAYVAEQFGKAVQNKPYLRSALNTDKLSDVADSSSAHRVSQVLVGAMYQVLMRLSKHYEESKRSVLQSFWDLAARMQRMFIQPLDLLPPMDVTFRDYSLAVLRTEQLSNPLDPQHYRDVLIEVFREREILTAEDEQLLRTEDYLLNRQKLSVYHSIDDISRSRASAYRFLNDNREDLFIPAVQDFVIADLYDAHKLGRQANPMPRQVVLQYLWREDVLLNGPEFGRFDGQSTSMLCGGTLVFDDSGNLLWWARKPGTRGKVDKRWAEEIKAGEQRRREFLAEIARQIAAGRVGSIGGSEKGMLGTRVPPIVAEGDNGSVHFRLSPHLHLSEVHHEEDDLGERQWQISC